MPEPGDLAPEGAILPSRERAIIISRPLRRELVGRNRRAGMRVPWGRVDLEYDICAVRSASSQFGVLALDCTLLEFNRSIDRSLFRSRSFVCCPGRVAVHMWMRLQRRKHTTPPGELISAVHAPDPTTKSAMLFYAERDNKGGGQTVVLYSKYVVCGIGM
jgi:hypothetical protein